MNWDMSDWEVRRVRDTKMQQAIQQAEQDRLARINVPAEHTQADRWLIPVLMRSLVVAVGRLLHG